MTRVKEVARAVVEGGAVAAVEVEWGREGPVAAVEVEEEAKVSARESQSAGAGRASKIVRRQ